MNRRPNILLFMTDQQQQMVTLPNHPCRTPNLDKLASEGLRFTHTYTTMAHCCPARASFMTGLYPSQHGIHNNVSNSQALGISLKAGVETFSEKLKASGYDMCYTGKWHVAADETPKDRGWEEYYPTFTGKASDEAIRSHWLKTDPGIGKTERKRGEILRPGWGTYKLYGMLKDGIGSHGDKQDESDCKGDFEVLKHGIEKLKDMKGNNSPWCLYIGLLGPHEPLVIPEKYARLYDPKDIDLPPNYHDDLHDKPAVYKRMRKLWDKLTEEEVKESLAYYWGYCTMLDDMFGEVLNTLDKIGEKDNTMVVFVSDHGEHCGAHGIYCKGISSFDEGYRVPLIIRYPNGIKNPGRVVDKMVSLMDIAPTLVEVAEAEPLKKCAGKSLVPFMNNQNPPWRNEIFTQCNGVEVYYTQRVVRSKEFKYVYTPVDFDELYDLRNDPYEMRNVIDSPEYAGIKKEYIKKMWQYCFESEDTIFIDYAPISMADFGPAIVNEQ